MIKAYHEDPVIQAFMLFIQTAREIMKYSDSRFYRDLHLSTVKYIALMALAISGGILTNSDLAVWTDTKRHNITTLIQRMRAEGLVTTKRGERDKRYKHVQLTEKGRDYLTKANDVAYDLINRVMSGIDKPQAAQLETLLSILKKNTIIATEGIK